jgi:flagellar basal-body rod protein FlgB
MLPDIFETTDLLQKGLSATQLRQDTISNNIANIDTPGFKSSHVEFESYMKEALQGGEGGLEAKVTRDKHIPFHHQGSPMDVQPAVIVDSSTTMRMDGNNVDIDAEMSEMAKNNIYYDTLVTKMNGELSRLKLAIDGR